MKFSSFQLEYIKYLFKEEELHKETIIRISRIIVAYAKFYSTTLDNFDISLSWAILGTDCKQLIIHGNQFSCHFCHASLSAKALMHRTLVGNVKMTANKIKIRIVIYKGVVVSRIQNDNLTNKKEKVIYAERLHSCVLPLHT